MERFYFYVSKLRLHKSIFMIVDVIGTKNRNTGGKKVDQKCIQRKYLENMQKSPFVSFYQIAYGTAFVENNGFLVEKDDKSREKSVEVGNEQKWQH